MAGSVIVAGARTPIGKFSGGLSALKATELGSHAIAGALQRAGITGDQVDYVIMGQVIAANSGQVPARQAAVGAGIPLTVPANTINKACLSGLNAIYMADHMVASGDAEVVVAGGMESMTNTPYLLPKARAGYRMGHGELLDSLLTDGLFCSFEHCHMGEGTERYAASAGLDRVRQDELAAASHERAARAAKNGLFDNEIVPIEVPQRRGDPVLIDADEGIRPGTTAESLAELRPAFSSSGNVTAGNSSQISDGASAVVVMSPAKAAELGLEPLAELVSFGMVSGPDMSLLTQPSRAIRAALAKTDLDVSDISLFEMNEAFAAVAAAATADLGVSDDIVNVNGGAIALGHPVGMSGNRISFHLINELRRRGGGYGAAGLCGGGGQGDALIVRVG